MIRRLSYQAGTNVFLAIPLLILPFVIAHQGTPADLAKFAIGITIASILTGVVEYGSSLLLAKETARFPGRGVNSLVRACLWSSFMLGAVILAGSALFAALQAIDAVPSFNSGFFWVLAASAIAGPSRVARGLFVGRQSFGLDTVLTGVQETIFAVLGVVLYTSTGSVSVVFAVFFGSRLVGLVGALSLFRQEFNRYDEQCETPEWAENPKATLATATPYFLNGLLAIMYLRVDLLLLAWLGTTLDVANYEAGSLLVVRATVLIQVLTAVSLPSISRMFAKRGDALQPFLRSLGVIALSVGVPIAAVLALFNSQIIDLLFGDGFDTAAQVLAILGLLVPTKFVANVLATALTACDMQQARTKSVATAAITNIVLNLVFIPFYGLWAAVWSTVVTEVLLLFAFVYHLARIAGITKSDMRNLAGSAALITMAGIGLASAELEVAAAAAVALLLLAFWGKQMLPSIRSVRTSL